MGGWNAAVWLDLVLIGVMLLRADHERVRQVAVPQADAAATVLFVVVWLRSRAWAASPPN